VGRGSGVVEPAPIVAEPVGDDDHRLVAAVRRGDDRAFEALYARYHRRIHAYVLGMVKDHGRAEDVTQEVFVSALRRMRETERPIAFKPWVYEIAKNACIDQFRRSKRAEEVSLEADEGFAPNDYLRLTGSDPAPHDAVAAKQELNDLCGAFGGLSDTHHEILVLRELEGLSYREIGDRMGMSRPAVESTLFRARRRLTEEYDDLVSGARCMRIQSIIAMAAEGSLGARETRRLSRHVSHCQPCRREAMAAGLDAAILTHVPLRKRAAAKVAGLLPFPVFDRWRANAAAHAPALSEGLSGGWGKLATAAAVVAAGVGVAGVGTEIAARHDKPAPTPKRAAAATGGAAAQRTAHAATTERTAGAPATTAPRRTTHARRAHENVARTSAPQTGSGTTGSAPAATGGSSGASAPAGTAGGATAALPKATLPAASTDPTAPVKQTVDNTVNDVTQTVSPVVHQVTDPVTDALPPPVGDTVDGVGDAVEQGTGITLP
jgi:RNA polymerase sigma factor (sigma-70 family)